MGCGRGDRTSDVGNLCTHDKKYGQRGVRYVPMEVGHASQNVLFLQTVFLNLKAVVVGAFADNTVKNALKMHPDEHPLCIMPISW